MPPETVCAHCGLLAPDPVFNENRTTFCCTGCRFVFQFLHENDCSQYYEMEPTPGVSFAVPGKKPDYSHLDQIKIRRRILQYSDQSIESVSLRINSMHCIACVWLLENLSKFLPGIRKCRVDFSKRSLFLTYEHAALPLSQIMSTLWNLGYEGTFLKENEKRESSAALIEVGIAGFCFANCMLFSFPEYLSASIPSSFQILFQYLSLLLCLASVLFCSSHYFKRCWLALKKGMLNLDLPICLGIGGLLINSVWNILILSIPGYCDSLCGFLFFLQVARYFQEFTQRHLDFQKDTHEFFPIAVKKIGNDSNLEIVHPKDLEIGDIIQLKPGDVIPCDSTLLSENAILDYSFITGESLPVSAQQDTFLFAGGKVVDRPIQTRVGEVFSSGQLLQAWNRGLKFTDRDPELTLADRLAKFYTPSILVLGLSAFYLGWSSGPQNAVLNALCVLIVACPCAIAISSPFTCFTTMQILAKYGIFFHDPSCIERAWNLNTLLWDKTGTLTFSSARAVIDGELSPDELILLRSLAGYSNHPICTALSEEKVNTNSKLREVRESPGEGISGLDSRGNRFWIGRSAKNQGGKDNGSAAVIEINGEFRAHIYLQESPREEVPEILEELSPYYDLELLTGDSRNPLVSIPETVLSRFTTVFHNVSPEFKRKRVEHLQNSGRKVGFIGDGINDSPALAQGDLAFSIMERKGQFTPYSDCIFHSQILPLLPRGMEFVRRARIIVRLCFLVGLSYNIAGLTAALCGYLTPGFSAFLMPLSSLSVTVLAVSSCFWLERTYLSPVLQHGKIETLDRRRTVSNPNPA